MNVTIEMALACNEWKTCSKCEDEKKVVFFSRMGDKYRPECKACDAIAYRNRKSKKYIESKKEKTAVEKFTTWLKSLVQ